MMANDGNIYHSASGNSSTEGLSFPGDYAAAISSSQRRMLVHQSAFPESVAYNVGITLNISGNIDRGALESSILSLCSELQNFRKLYTLTSNGVATWSVGSQFNPFSADSSADLGRESFISHSMSTPFDLGAGNLLRCRIDSSEKCTIVTLITHHICWDAASFPLLINALDEGYNSAVLGNDIGIIPDFRELRNEGAPIVEVPLEESLDYWREFITKLTTDDPRTLGQSACAVFESNVIERELDRDLVGLIGEVAYREAVTEFAVVSAALNVSLSAAGGTDTVTIASTPSTRSGGGEALGFGYFANTTPYVVKLLPALNVNDMVTDSSLRLAELIRYSCVPYEDIVNMARIAKISNPSNLFDIMVQYSSMDAGTSIGGHSVDFRILPSRQVEVPAVFELVSSGDSLDMQIKFRSDMFESSVASILPE
ncbi:MULTISPECIES: condensation domain-containing protein, partial [Corynebacterium]